MRKSVLILALSTLGSAALPSEAAVAERTLCKDKFEQLQQRLKTEPDNPQAWQEFRVCVTELKRWHDGDVAATQALKKNPDHSEAHLLLGVTRLHSKAYTKAAESFDEAIRTRHDNAQAYYYLGMAYLFQSLPLEASKAAERAAELEPGKAANFSQLAYAYFLIDEQTKCEAAARKAIALDADNVAAYKVLGNLYQRQGKQAQSDAMFEAAIHANGRLTAAAPIVAAKKTLPGMSAAAASAAPAIVPDSAADDSQEERPQSKAEIEDFLSRQWTAMKEALKAGNIPKGLSYYSDYAGTREAYRQAFEKMSVARLRQIYTSLSDIEDCEIVLQAATCNVTLSSAGTLRVTKVRFERNADKVWRIRSY
jgi:tetratricopeptide (TPR) repeat protein